MAKTYFIPILIWGGLFLFPLLLNAQPGGIKSGDVRTCTGKAPDLSCVPVDSVVVTAYSQSGDTAWGRTDSAGSCTIRNVRPGVYTLVYFKPGYAEVEIKGVVVSANKLTYLMEVRMPPADTPRKGVRLIPAKD